MGMDGESLNKTDPTADIKTFFRALPQVPGQAKKRMSCILCANGLGCVKQDKVLSYEHSTLRRHAASLHLRRYKRWCKENKFESMLPDDTRQRREAALDKGAKILQSTITRHFQPENAAEKPIAYSEKAFACAAIEWLIEANIPPQVLDSPSFKRMVDLASRANHGVKLPSPRQTRGRVIKMFKQQMCLLKERLNSPAVSGDISLTCDAWQGDTTDGYFAITGHWIEERAVGEWTEEHALFGFTQLDTVHNGTRLGQMLYKVCNRLGVVHKVGHITCDNAKNSMEMIQEFARCYDLKTGSTFDTKRRYIGCLAHTINSATQVVISTRSKSKYYSGDPEDDYLPEDPGATERDEIGIIRAISVKARSSTEQKDLFKTVQERSSALPCQLLLDTEVRWSSTFVMLIRAESRRQAVDEFVGELILREADTEKRRKLVALTLDEEEWTRVRLLCNILQHADDALHTFSTGSRPTLHGVLPALEKLIAEWQKASGKPRYETFVPALTAGVEELDEYYKRSGPSDAHLVVMVLNPSSKMRHFKKYWDPDLLLEVEHIVQMRFIQKYNDLRKHAATIFTHDRKPSSSNNPRRLNIDDTDSESDEDSEDVDPDRLWLNEWSAYLNSDEVVPEGMGTVHWWGIHGQRYPTWQSLARDYLAIMASSVSSESLCSAAGITTSKCHNRPEGDVVEALQCLKSFTHQDLPFHDVVNAAQEEEHLDLADQEPANRGASSSEVVRDGERWGWDELVEGLDDDEGTTAP